MRPRVFPAEDAFVAGDFTGANGTSMRPRVFPAEDRVRVPAAASTGPYFNEAAGIPRGRRHRCLTRPPVARAHFNEAAGIPRGRHLRIRTDVHGEKNFNEAAGIPRGRRRVPMADVARFILLQ